MKRRNVDVSKLRRPIVRRGRMSEDIYGSAFTYIKFFSVWMFILMADFILDFRFEYLWPLWLLARSVCDSMKYQGLAFSIFFVCITITSDVACYLLIPVQWLFFTASTYVWVQYIWQTERGVCLPTVLLWLMFLYIEVAVRLRELRNFPFHLDLCRPFAAHCVGYPVVTMGFSIKSCISYRFRLRKQKEVEKANSFYYQLLQQALPSDLVTTNDKPKALPGQTQDDPVLNGSTTNIQQQSTALSSSSSLAATARSRTLGWLDLMWTGGRDKTSAASPGATGDSVEDFEYLEQTGGRADDRGDDTSSEEGGTLPGSVGDECRGSAGKSSGARANSTTRDSLSSGKRGGKPGSTASTASSWVSGKDTPSAPGSKLEADLKRLKAELQSSRCLEQELRSQISSLSFNDRSTKSELYQLRQENETLQSKLQKLVSSRQQDKQNLAILERRVQEERKQKTTLEQQLTTERQRRKVDESSRVAVAMAASPRPSSVECSSDQCQKKRSELENESKLLRHDLKSRDDDIRQLKLQTQTLQQYRGDSQTETEVLMSTLENMKDKNAHLETSLSAETRLKLDLFSALGDAKRQMEIQQGLLMQKEIELSNLRAKLGDFMAFMPSVTLSGFGRAGSAPGSSGTGSGASAAVTGVRYSPTYTAGGGAMQPPDSSVVPPDYTSSMSQ